MQLCLKPIARLLRCQMRTLWYYQDIILVIGVVVYIIYNTPRKVYKSVTVPVAHWTELPRETAIFFFETSTTRTKFDLLHLCSFESAANQNPKSEIVILINKLNTKIGNVPELLSRVANINFYKFDLYGTMNDTPLRDLISMKDFEAMHHHDTTLEEIVRVALLYLVGGTHLDYDVISTGSSPRDIPNYLIMEQYWRLNNCIMKFSAGNEFLLRAMREMPSRLGRTAWGNLGPVMFTELAFQLCSNKTSSGYMDFTFLCPSAYNTVVFSMEDMVMIQALKRLKEFAFNPYNMEKLPKLSFIHLCDVPNDSHDDAVSLRYHWKMLFGIMEVFCPMTAQIIQDRANQADPIPSNQTTNSQ